MCLETDKEVFKMASDERARFITRLYSKTTKDFDRWWIGKIIGWFDAAEGDIARTRKLLNLPPCTCQHSGHRVSGEI